MSEIVSTKWLFNNLNDKNIVILDCSWFMPLENKNPKKEYKNKHIIGSHFFDINNISDQNSKLPHMLPDLNYFKNKVKNFNININSKIITYGSTNIMGPSRVWWMFKYFGFNNISILNGCLIKWIKEKKPITNKKSIIKKSNYKFKINTTWLTNKENITQNLNKKNNLILDARNNDRFKGKEKESRKGLRSGHIPSSKNFYWKEITKNGEIILNKKNLKEKFAKYKLKKNKNITLSCGSGISACVLSLSLLHALDIKGSIYDGSWAEWGSNKQLPIEK